MPADQYGVESGVEHSCLDTVGDSFLAGDQHLVVCRSAGILGSQIVDWYVADALGIFLQQSKGSSQGE